MHDCKGKSRQFFALNFSIKVIELFVFALFCYRTKRYAKYKVRVIMRYYWDEMKCNK